MIRVKINEVDINPLVSVIIPSYNRNETIGFAIDSIISQQCNFDFEIIIGEDCSTDNSREVLLAYKKTYPSIIKLLFHDKNIGLGANWATCVKKCRGKYIANCDNDDYWHHPGKLQMQVDFLESHPDYGVVHTDYRNHNRETGKITEVIVSNDCIEKPLQKSIFTGKFRFCNATMMYRKELIDRYLNLDDYIKYQFTLQDWNTWIILSKYTDFYCLPVSTSTFGIETESITRPRSYEQVEKRFQKEKECYKYVCRLFPEDLPFVESGYDTYVILILLNIAFAKMDYSKAIECRNKLKIIGSKTSKDKYIKNKFMFYIYSFLKKIKG